MSKKTAFIIHSKHTRDYAIQISKKYSNISFFRVSQPPTGKVFNIKTDKQVIIGIGGGSVIDTAKIVAGKKRAIVFPTTASGASATPYATVWGKEKHSVRTRKPIVKIMKDMNIHLTNKILISTFSDCCAHIFESMGSKNATILSKLYCNIALKYIDLFFPDKHVSIYNLIKAGHYAGKAIAIAKTNIIHAISYPLTIEHGMNHGLACGLLIPYFMDYLVSFNICKDFKSLSKKISAVIAGYYPNEIKHMHPYKIAIMAMRYKKINDCKVPMNIHILCDILQEIKDNNK